jgi:DNA-binding NtrC family response regulator
MKFLTQFLGKAAQGNNTINVVVVGKVGEEGESVKYLMELVERLGRENAELVAELERRKDMPEMRELLQSIRPPRLKTMEKAALMTAQSMYDTDKAAADFLGITRRVMSYKVHEFGLARARKGGKPGPKPKKKEDDDEFTD